MGEGTRQDPLWALCGGSLGQRIRHAVVAVLVPEPRNPHDPNAIAVLIEGHHVGYLPREIAAAYVAPLGGLMAACGAHVALSGVIVGGGYYEDGPGRLGVWLDHDPVDFGATPRRPAPARTRNAAGGSMRTGFSEALATDEADDSYDLSWYTSLPTGDRAAIATLRALLADERDPIDRHFQLAEVETRPYRSRDLYAAALDEFDEACRQHNAEMAVIREAFMSKWGKVPLLETW